MICISRRSCRNRFLSTESTSSPANKISPAVGSIKRSRQRPTVDLPQPDSPTRPKVSPAKISNETPSTARTTSSEPSTGKCFTRPRTLTSVLRVSAGDNGGPAWFAVSRCALMGSFVVCRHCGRKIVKHATHFNTAFELVKRNLFRGATRHTMRTAWREVTTGGQVSRTRHDAVDRFQTFLANHLRARELRNRTQQALGVRMLRPREQLVHRRLLDDPSRVHHGHTIRDFSNNPEIVSDQKHREFTLLSQLI